MSSKRLLLKDYMDISSDVKLSNKQKSGLWADTEILWGYGYNDGGLQASFLDEEIGIARNTVPIIGVQSAFQYLFGVKGPISFPTLYNETASSIQGAIGHSDVATDSNYNYRLPDHAVENDPTSSATTYTPIYNPGQFVQLFGVGVTGTAENNITVHKVGYRETSINMEGDPNGIMYPFRYTASELDPAEKTKYFGKRLDTETGAIGYYLKRFEGRPQIKHVWKTQDTMDSSNESLVTNDTLHDLTRNDAIQSFCEMHLQITKKDLKEFFTDKLEQPESCRFNCIALYDGYYTEEGKQDNELFGDYANVRLFSKLNIPTEHLSLQKDLEIIYRVYGS